MFFFIFILFALRNYPIFSLAHFPIRQIIYFPFFNKNLSFLIRRRIYDTEYAQELTKNHKKAFFFSPHAFMNYRLSIFFFILKILIREFGGGKKWIQYCSSFLYFSSVRFIAFFSSLSFYHAGVYFALFISIYSLIAILSCYSFFI